MADLREEIEKRRTFAIISHPDAGKTTLTEKFLLYGGAINLAGSVKGKATARHAVSDWMEIEKERGISVTSSVLQFNYDGYCINILDTPGHQDFSEDTYRTLMAADSAARFLRLPQKIRFFHSLLSFLPNFCSASSFPPLLSDLLLILNRRSCISTGAALFFLSVGYIPLSVLLSAHPGYFFHILSTVLLLFC